MDKGHLIIGGGAIKASKERVFSRFLEYAGGCNAQLRVITVASCFPAESYASVAETLTGLGLPEKNLQCIPLTLEADLIDQGWKKEAKEELLPYLEGVSGIWFTGGDQMKIVQTLLTPNGEDTILLKRVRRILNEGGVVGGTSAGAAVMSHYMIGRGSDEGALNYPVCTVAEEYTDEYDRQERLLLIKGLGFFTEGIVDQHFNIRARLQRLMTAMRYFNIPTGYGISEDTAMCVSLSDHKCEIIGSGYIMKVVHNGLNCFTTSFLDTEAHV